MITQELGERVRDAREAGDKIALSLSAAELSLLHRLGIVSDAAEQPGGLYRPGPNFLLFCSVVFAERVDEINRRLEKDGGIRGVGRVTEILTEIDHLPDDDQDEEDDEDGEGEAERF